MSLKNIESKSPYGPYPYYPIRSGYFFNPTGTYTFTLTTVIYKETDDDTIEHKDFVNAIINSFRYKSDMVYITPDRKAVTIDGNEEKVDKTGTSYGRSRAFAAVWKEPRLFRIKVDDDYKKIILKELEHDYTESGTDDRFKPVMEGYEESNTLKSKEEFEYVEFVHNNETVYKIEETTTVTITINPDNVSLYTHAMMKNGDYSISVYIDNVSLDALTNESLTGDLFGVGILDRIYIKVVGSMYDDIR